MDYISLPTAVSNIYSSGRWYRWSRWRSPKIDLDKYPMVVKERDSYSPSLGIEPMSFDASHRAF
ncbi:hypothetical protein D9M70_590670 [compost metagenome]